MSAIHEVAVFERERPVTRRALNPTSAGRINAVNLNVSDWVVVVGNPGVFDSEATTVEAGVLYPDGAILVAVAPRKVALAFGTALLGGAPTAQSLEEACEHAVSSI